MASAAIGPALGVVGGIAGGIGAFLQPEEEAMSFLPDPNASEMRADKAAMLATQLGDVQLGDLTRLENLMGIEGLAELGFTADYTQNFQAAEDARRVWQDFTSRGDEIALELAGLTEGRAGGSRTAAQEVEARAIDKRFRQERKADPSYQRYQKQVANALKDVRKAEPDKDGGFFGGLFGKVGLDAIGNAIDEGVGITADIMMPGFGDKALDMASGAAERILGYDENQAKSTKHRMAIKKLKKIILEQKAYKESMPGWQTRQDAIAALPPGGKPGDRAELTADQRRRVIELQNEQKVTRASIDRSAIAMRRAEEDAFRITGINREIDEDTKAGRVNAIESELEKRVLAASRGEAAADPVLEREIEGRRRTLEEQLRRDVGADFASSTQGSRALRDFERSSSEARAAAQRQVVMDFVPVAGAFAQKQAQAQKNLFGVINPGLTLFEAGREHARDFTALAEKKQRERIAYAGASQMIQPQDKTADFLQTFGAGLAGTGAGLSGGGMSAPGGYTR